MNTEMKPETVADYLKTMGLGGSLDHINEEPDVKALLAGCIEKDIQQYIEKIESNWKGKAVVVKIKDDDAFAVWDDHWMPTVDLYRFVYDNGGFVTPKDFEKYE